MIAAGIVLSIILENIVGSGFPYFLLASCAKRTSSRVEEQNVWYKQTNKQNLRNSISRCQKHVHSRWSLLRTSNSQTALKLWQRVHKTELNTFTGKTRRKWCPRGKTCRLSKIQRAVIALFKDKQRPCSMEIHLSRAAAEDLFTSGS